MMISEPFASDEIIRPQIKYRARGELKYLDRNGLLKKLNYAECDGNITINKKMKALGTLVLVEFLTKDITYLK